MSCDRKRSQTSGCLLFHGFSGSPREMMPLAEVLGLEGWRVSAVPLAGHDTAPQHLATTTWQDWLGSARDAYDELVQHCQRVALIGLSMGGALALHLAASAPAVAVVAISTPIRVHRIFVGASRIGAKVLPLAPILFRPGPRDPAMRPYRSPYDRLALGAVREVAALLEEMRKALPALQVPLLIVQGRRDWVIPRSSGREILDLAAAAPGRLLWLPHSGHVATLDRDRQTLNDEVAQFLRVHLRRWEPESPDDRPPQGSSRQLKG